jgi:hypothetical protein
MKEGKYLQCVLDWTVPDPLHLLAVLSGKLEARLFDSRAFQLCLQGATITVESYDHSMSAVWVAVEIDGFRCGFRMHDAMHIGQYVHVLGGAVAASRQTRCIWAG